MDSSCTLAVDDAESSTPTSVTAATEECETEDERSERQQPTPVAWAKLIPLHDSGEPSGEAEHFIITEPIITLGRSRHCDLVIDWPEIADRHCALRRDSSPSSSSASPPASAFILDLYTNSGTFISSSPSEWTPLPTL
ncbi:MAG: FHA domain-containing protein, partial [archaeon]|nr:FHA domain-containing protein [archaeon]